MFVKKLIFFLIFVLFFLPVSAQSGYFTGDGGKDKRVLAYTSTLENGKKDAGDQWIPSKIKRDIVNILINCSNLTVINSDEKENIRKLQKEYESSEYSDENPVQLGKSIQAKYYIVFTTTRITSPEEKYSLSATIYNIETRRAEGGYTSAQYTQSEFISKVPPLAGIELLEKLGVKLTEAGKRLIKNGSLYTAEEKADLKTSKENLDAINAELERIGKEQAKLSLEKQLSLEAENEKARMETQKALLLQQQKNEEERIARLKADFEREQEEERAKLERDEEKQKEILRLTMQVESRAEEIRKKTTDKLSALEQITVIEAEKQTLVSNNSEIEKSISDFTKKQNELRNAEIKERNSRPPRTADLKADGKTLTENAQLLLKADIDAINKKYDEIIKKNDESTRKGTEKAQNILREKISDDIKALEAKNYTASSITDAEVYLRINNWDGTKGREGWQFTLSFGFGGQKCLTQKGLLTYSEVTGEKIPELPDSSSQDYEKQKKEYEKFYDTVDNYDSFFRMNVPYLEAVIKYKVVSGSYFESSRYIITVVSVEFKNVITGKTVKTVSVSGNAVYVPTPSVTLDWRTDRQKNIDTKKKNKESKDSKKEQTKKESTKEKQESSFQEGRFVFGSIYKIIPGAFNLYVTGNGTRFLTTGYFADFPLCNNFYLGGNAEIGLCINEGTSDSEDIIKTGRDRLFFNITGTAGLSYNIIQNIRTGIFAEAGYVWKDFGYGGGVFFELYSSKAIGITASFSILRTGDIIFQKYSAGLEICF
ncbi:MAG: hypothetical protein J5780_02190 [Treponema sp.]|nr:hypothetical protein [Treponema sp.]